MHVTEGGVGAQPHNPVPRPDEDWKGAPGLELPVVVAVHHTIAALLSRHMYLGKDLCLTNIYDKRS